MSTLPCGHAPSAVSGSDEGTQYCRECEAAGREPLYYIQNTGFRGNCLGWWKPEGHGYTLDLNKAWKVPFEKAKSICRSRPEEDIMWAAETIDSVAARHVNIETLRASLERAARPADGEEWKR